MHLFHWYSCVPFAFLLLPKHFTFDSFANLVPNCIALFLNLDDSSRPKSKAILRSNFFYPAPSVIELIGKLLKYVQSGRYKNGYLTYFAIPPNERSSRPRFRIHNLSISNIIYLYNYSRPALLKAILYRE
jgi:hypothetical protein